MKVTKPLIGVPCYVELSTPDLAGASAFYGGLFGWNTVPDSDPQAGGYSMAHLGDEIVAGMGPVFTPEQPVSWLMSIGVESVDETVGAAIDAGATVLTEPMEVFEYGRYAVLADPTGAAFAVWQARSFPGSSLLGEDATLVWVELNTRDPKAAVDFYTSVFGWSATESDGYLQWGRGEDFGGMMEIGSDLLGVPAHWLVYFGVADADAAVAKVAELGGATRFGPQDIAGHGRFAVVSDPQGAVFAIYARTRE